MNIARITDIQPDGTWSGPNGVLYQLLVTFDDGTVGQANAKSQNPPYKRGDQVGYMISGTYPGGNKIKIDAKAPQNQPARQSVPATQTAIASQTARSPAQTARPASAPATGQINGATVGMSVKAAVDILIHNAGTNAVELTTLQRDIEGIASAIIAAAIRLESGRVKVDTESENVAY